MMLQKYSGTWQPSTHYVGNVFQLPVAKGEMDLLRDRIKQLEAELVKSSPIIGSTTVANSGKNFISIKSLHLTSQ